MNTYYNVVSHLCESMLSATESLLSEPSTLRSEDARDTLRRYAAAIDGNFIPCVSATLLSVRSVYARTACELNLYEELRDDHPGMLKRFIQAAHAEPRAQDYFAVEQALIDMHANTVEMNGLKNMTLMTLCESSSIAFIPYIAELAKQCGSTEHVYTDVHGVADIAHAQECQRALEKEMEMYTDPESVVNAMQPVLLNVWSAIYTIPSQR